MKLLPSHFWTYKPDVKEASKMGSGGFVEGFWELETWTLGRKKRETFHLVRPLEQKPLGRVPRLRLHPQAQKSWLPVWTGFWQVLSLPGPRSIHEVLSYWSVVLFCKSRDRMRRKSGISAVKSSLMRKEGSGPYRLSLEMLLFLKKILNTLI